MPIEAAELQLDKIEEEGFIVMIKREGVECEGRLRWCGKWK